MSKQTGLIRLKGTIGGVTFYKSEGEDLARLANGPDKEKIDNDPAFQRTRENNKEFGGCASAAKALRLSLANVIHTMADSRLTSRLTALFKRINLSGSGLRGERPILLSANHILIENFEFNRKTPLTSVFNAQYSAVNNTDRNQGEINIPSFIPDNFIIAPSGATHFRLLQAIGAISDYVYDAATGFYEPADPLNAVGNVMYSALLPVKGPGLSPISLVVDLPASPAVGTDVSVIQCLGIEFFQLVGTEYYLLAQGNAMKVLRVF